MNTIDWKYASPEQINFWKHVRGLIAYTTITPLYYSGVFLGSEFLVYNAGKLYMALELNFNGATVPQPPPQYVETHNMADAANNYHSNQTLAWDVTAAAFKTTLNDINLKNIWFSRIVTAGYSSIMFNGYRLNV